MLTIHGSWLRLEMQFPETAYRPLGFAAGPSNLYEYVGNGPTDGVDPSGMFEISKMMDKLEEKYGVEMRLLLEYMLDQGGWSLATGKIDSDEIRKGYAVKAVGAGAWRNHTAAVDIDVSLNRLQAYESLGHNVERSATGNSWMIDYTDKVIWIDSSYTGSSAEYMATVIQTIMKREEQAKVTSDTIDANAAKLGDKLTPGAMVTAADPCKTQIEAGWEVKPLIYDLGAHVAIEVGTSLGGPIALKGIFSMLKAGYRIAGPAIYKGGKALIEFSRPVGQVLAGGSQKLNAYMKTVGRYVITEIPALTQPLGSKVCLPTVLRRILGSKPGADLVLKEIERVATLRNGYGLEEAASNLVKSGVAEEAKYLKQITLRELQANAQNGGVVILNVPGSSSTSGHAIAVTYNAETRLFTVHDPLISVLYEQDARTIMGRLEGERVGDAIIGLKMP
jgi:hypothetical protein